MVATTTIERPAPQPGTEHAAAEHQVAVVDSDASIPEPGERAEGRDVRPDATNAPTTSPGVPGAGSVRVEQLVEAEPVVRRICRSDLGYWDGDDAAQEALTHVWRASQRPDFEDRGTLVPFGVACARGQVKTGYGRRDRRPEPVGDQAEWGREFADTDTLPPDEAAERAEHVATARRRVDALLDELTPRQRQAVTECALRERGTDEVAAELGMSPSSVRSSQVRAMARMRELCGTRSTNPLARNRTAAEQYDRNRQEWERLRGEREQAEGRTIARRASRHRVAHVAAGRLPADTSPTVTAGAGGSGGPDAVARAAAAAERARAAVAAGLVDDTGQDAARRSQLAAWHRDDHGDLDDHGDGAADGWTDGPGAGRGAGAA